MGPYRIYTQDGMRGGLAVARAFGDLFYKDPRIYQDSKIDPMQQLVCAVPEITQNTLCDDDEFIIVASDGFWDVYSNEEAVALALQLLKTVERTSLASALVKAAFAKESMDNISVVVAFPSVGKIAADYEPEEKKQEAEEVEETEEQEEKDDQGKLETSD
eukprot:TRINITY_DN733_c0_g1_i2.p1 TRINITY_DN733_c0_g1~~TRINITY_DN733_c0_g1_i2.p1  ORF type:complete len:160 (-),score=40.46 TRINITY_DN733_c0_g1_i2:107-586(-)